MTIDEGLAEEVERYNTIYHHYSRIREGEKCYDSLLRSGKVECRAGGAAGTSSGNRDQAPPTELGICAHSLAADIAATRKRVEETTRSALPATGIESEIGGGDSSSEDLISRVSVLETENREMRSEIQDLRVIIEKLQAKVEGHVIKGDSKPAEKEPAREEEDIDLFGSDEEEDEEKEKIKEARVKAYEAKKEKKPGAVAKSSVILDVKPWDDETDMKEIESVVRSIDMDGLLWGASKLVPLAYGVKKLQIMCVVEDEKVSVDELTEKIEEHEDLVQSVDIAAFNKI